MDQMLQQTINDTLTSLKQGADRLQRAQSPLDDAGAAPAPGILSHRIEDLENFVKNGFPVKPQDLPAYIDAVKNMAGPGINDRLFLLEKLVALMSRLPEGSKVALKMERAMINVLYKDLPHPPQSYLALPSSDPPPPPSSFTNNKRVKYAFRTDDGSNYNVLLPNLGRANMPYARTVPSLTYTPAASLPDPGLVFDTLLKRDAYEQHPAGISSLFFAFANLVIHSIFDTGHSDKNRSDETINGASSYLDLSPLYGGGGGIQTRTTEQMRRLDGTGRLWEDSFADGRLLYMPPASAALLVLLCRNHNYIAAKILDINEKGNFTNPPPKDAEARRDQDDEVYHRARLVNCGFFMQIILRDYVGAILGLARDGSSWRLDPLEDMRDSSHEIVTQGAGNAVSIEFNMLYRWHATASEADERWTKALFDRLLGGKPYDQVTPADFRNGVRQEVVHHNAEPVQSWTFGGLKRGTDGRFADADLAKIIQDATEAPAAAFKARGTPAYMRIVEILGIEQNRRQGVCSLNEFRKFMGLKPYASFKEWNPKPEIWQAAERLYTDIDNLELHVGMQAEEAKRPMPGAGLCPGYTISRAILADAVALVRGDRFLTTEQTPYNLTSWGYQDILADTADGAYGGILTKLLFRTLPDHYPAGSAYAHFPFLVPSKMREYMCERHDPAVDKYTWERPPVPAPLALLTQYDAVQAALQVPGAFSSGADVRLSALTRGVPVDRPLVDGVLFSAPSVKTWQDKLAEEAKALIDEKSIELVKSKVRAIDIVQHVVNLLPVHLIADNIVGLPLKTRENTHGVFREEELYEMFATIGNHVMLNMNREHDWHLRESSATSVETITGYIRDHLSRLSKGLLSVAGVRDQFNQFVWARNDESDLFLRQLLAAAEKTDKEADELAAAVVAEVVATAPLYSSALAHVLEFYLDEARTRERADIAAIAAEPNTANDTKLVGYIREALRLNPPVSAVYRTAKQDVTAQGNNIKPGQRVLVSIEQANMDVKAVGSEPEEASYYRDARTLGLYSLGGHGLLDPAFFEKTAPRVLRTVFGLKNLRPAPGKSGILNSFTQDLHGVPQRQYIDALGKVTPFPASLVVQYDL